MNAYSPVTQDVDALFQKTKGQLFYKSSAGFLGRLLAQVSFEWMSGPDMPTAAISTKTLYWNPEFFLSLTPSTRVTVLAHELWHNGALHGPRMGNRCPDKWNEAADHMINLRLKKDGFDMSGFPYLMDPRFEDMATEDIYDILVSEGGKPMERPMGSDLMPCSKEDLYDAVGKVVAAVTAAQLGGVKPGQIPGEITLAIDNFLNPKLPWEVLLFNYFNELTNDEYSFARPNRRYDDPMMPGKTGSNGLEHLMYFQDISGSISDDNILRFNSELKFVWDELAPQRMTVQTFDTEIQDTYEFETGDVYEKIIVTGRGGTCLKEVFAQIKKEQPSCAVIFTDLGVEIPQNPGVPIIWVCVDNPSGQVPYGRLVHVND